MPDESIPYDDSTVDPVPNEDDVSPSVVPEEDEDA